MKTKERYRQVGTGLDIHSVARNYALQLKVEGPLFRRGSWPTEVSVRLIGWCITLGAASVFATVWLNGW